MFKHIKVQDEIRNESRNFVYSEGTSECVWKKIFKEEDREEMSRGLEFTLIISIVCGLCLYLRTNTPIYQRLKNKKSYGVLQLFFLATLLKNLACLASFANNKTKFQSLPSDKFFKSCKFYGALYNFFNIFELETLTHVCIERYVNAKYIAHGWDLSVFGYWMYWVISLVFATFYTFLPFFGFGSYGYDYNCIFCTLNMVELDEFQGVIYILKTIKPVFIMYVAIPSMALLAASKTTVYVYKQPQLVRQELMADVFFNKVVKNIMVVNLMFWMPTFLVRMNTILSQLFLLSIQASTANLISWSWFIAQLAPVATLVALLIEENRSRNELRKMNHKN